MRIISGNISGKGEVNSLMQEDFLNHYSYHDKKKFIRKYKIRVYGYIDENSLDRISKGVKINNIQYAPFEYKLLKKGNANSWVEFHMREGKK